MSAPNDGQLVVMTTLEIRCRSVWPPLPAVKPIRVLLGRVIGALSAWAPSMVADSTPPVTTTVTWCRARSAGTWVEVVFQIRLLLLAGSALLVRPMKLLDGSVPVL